MNNSFGIVMGAIIVGSGIAVSGVVTDIGKQTLDQQKMAACWNPNLASGLNSLATQEAASLLKETYPPSMSQQGQDAVTASLSATLANYAFTGASPDDGTINCEASIAYSYTRPDGTKYAKDDGSVITYTMHPAESGWSYEMNGASIPMGVVSYVDDANQNSASSNQSASQ